MPKSRILKIIHIKHFSIYLFNSQFVWSFPESIEEDFEEIMHFLHMTDVATP